MGGVRVPTYRNRVVIFPHELGLRKVEKMFCFLLFLVLTLFRMGEGGKNTSTPLFHQITVGKQQ